MSASGGAAAGYVPPFRVAERTRLSGGAEARVGLGRVEVGARWEWLRDTTAAGEPASGPGDLRLGTRVRVVCVATVCGGLGWEAKLPNATDEGELGTDETDVIFGGTVTWTGEHVGAEVDAGLAVLGNPLRFANQDDVPLLRGRLRATLGPVTLAPGVSADLPTSRNPARIEAGGVVSAGSRWFAALEGAAGLTPAAADWRAVATVGWRGALPDAPSGE
ncbi:MAG: hypothetical protein ACOZNI_13740 [Myxococcota bacterium]